MSGQSNRGTWGGSGRTVQWLTPSSSAPMAQRDLPGRPVLAVGEATRGTGAGVKVGISIGELVLGVVLGAVGMHLWMKR